MCEYVSVNPDGTATLVRTGLARLLSPQLPLSFGAMVYVEIKGGELENGPHEMLLEVVGEKGTVSRVQGKLGVVDSTQPSRITLPFLVKAESYGEYRVKLKVGNLQDDMVFTVEAPPKKGTTETTDASSNASRS
jgi:hypothetical protein